MKIMVDKMPVKACECLFAERYFFDIYLCPLRKNLRLTSGYECYLTDEFADEKQCPFLKAGGQE